MYNLQEIPMHFKEWLKSLTSDSFQVKEENDGSFQLETVLPYEAAKEACELEGIIITPETYGTFGGAKLMATVTPSAFPGDPVKYSVGNVFIYSDGLLKDFDARELSQASIHARLELSYELFEKAVDNHQA